MAFQALHKKLLISLATIYLVSHSIIKKKKKELGHVIIASSIRLVPVLDH